MTIADTGAAGRKSSRAFRFFAVEGKGDERIRTRAEFVSMVEQAKALARCAGLKWKRLICCARQPEP